MFGPITVAVGHGTVARGFNDLKSKFSLFLYVVDSGSALERVRVGVGLEFETQIDLCFFFVCLQVQLGGRFVDATQRGGEIWWCWDTWWRLTWSSGGEGSR